MIHVIAAIGVKPGKRDEFLRVFKANVPAVLAEQGCLGYAPTVDVEGDLPIQKKDPNVVTIVEKWASLECLNAHLQAPHMARYRENVKDLVTGVSLNVLTDA